MNQSIKIIFSFLIVFITSKFNIAQPTIINEDSQMVPVNSGLSSFDEIPDSTLPINKVLKKYEEGLFKPLQQKMPSYWMEKEGHWVHFRLINRSESKLVMEVNNSLIDELNAYIIINDSCIDSLPRLGWKMPISERHYHTHQNCYPLKLTANSTYDIFIRVKREWLTLKVPIVLWKEEYFLEHLFYNNSLYGFYGGLIFFISIFATALYVYTRDYKYLYYALYCMSVLGWRFLVEGTILGFTQRNLPSFQNPSMGGLLNMAAALFLLLFLEKFLLNKNSPAWHYKFNKYTRYGICLFAIQPFLPNDSPVKMWIYLLYYVSVFFIVLNVFISVFSGIKRKEKNAYIYVISILPLFIYIIIVSMGNVLRKDTPMFLYDNFFSVLVFEILVLSVGLALNFKKFVQEKQIILNELNQSQQEAFAMEKQLQAETIKRVQAQVELQQEKERISRDLHDSIGTDLSNIVYTIEYNKIKNENNTGLNDILEKLLANTKHTMEQLRSAIWVLNQTAITLDIFTKKLNNHIFRILTDKPIEYSFHITENNQQLLLPAKHALYLYRIVQESLSNTIKYANASKIQLQIGIDDEQQLTLLFFDNGQGFNTALLQKEDSYGLTNVRKRVAELNGSIAIHSSENGTQIKINISLKKDE